MRRMPWAVYLWPGLPQIWARGSWAALGVAVLAAGLLNLALLGSFGWDELVAPDLRNAAWVLSAVVWVGCGLFSVTWRHRQTALEHADGPDAFRQALDYYLKGNWFESQRIANRLLRHNPRDLDARLLLATLLRHTERWDEAGEQLDALVRLDGAEKWDWEIRRERQLLTIAPQRLDDDDVSLEAQANQKASHVREIHRPCPEGHATGQPGSSAVQP